MAKLNRRRSSRTLVPRITIVTTLLVLLGVAAAQWRAGANGPSTSSPCVSTASTLDPSAIIACAGSWQPTPLVDETQALLIAPNKPGTIYAATARGLRISENAGASWSIASGPLANTPLYSLASARSGAVYVGTDDSRLFMLADGKWRHIGTLPGGGPIFALAPSPGNSDMVLAATVGAIYRAHRVSGAWQMEQVASTGDSSVTAMAFAPWNDHQVFASVFGATPPVISSADDGVHWRPDAAGLPPSLPSQALIALPAIGSVAFSTMGQGAWVRSRDGAWRDISAGLPERHAMPLVAAGSRPLLFAGTMGFGVFYQAGRRSAWRRLGTLPSGAEYTVLSLALARGSSPVLLAGTARGVYRYMLNSSRVS